MNTNCDNKSTTWQPTGQGCGCACNHNMQCGMPSQSMMCNMPQGNMPQGVMPIVMPTQVMARQAFNFVEQPVIMPIECRTINRAVMIPRVYPTYTHTQVNCF